MSGIELVHRILLPMTERHEKLPEKVSRVERWSSGKVGCLVSTVKKTAESTE